MVLVDIKRCKNHAMSLHVLDSIFSCSFLRPDHSLLSAFFYNYLLPASGDSDAVLTPSEVKQRTATIKWIKVYSMCSLLCLKVASFSLEASLCMFMHV